MKKQLFTASTVLAISIASCTSARSPDDKELLNDCHTVCSRMKGLGCVEGFPIEVNRRCDATHECLEGETCSALGTCIVTCVSFCVVAVRQKVWVDVGCLKEIDDCSDIQTCPRCKEGACTTR